ncbi:FG-GAP-like repeat-containing protein [Hymenobacter cavernae]|uniref:T9SS C-terminal target domain-containing protein n=1 Tax=Hymenobacter cavernae TaxID=2044852 RepID=A0ABQ1TUQ1_9BACT|nr:FG-GAP-like repeat-containing protein [Hymenobacter cavernae]GGF04000.1 hypothetical protein GCM10011383_13840 [Hymenobacter cavernae]
MIPTPTFSFQAARSFCQFAHVLSAGAFVLLAGAAHAQAPTIVGLSPARNARSAPRATNVAVSFSQALSNNAGTLGALKVFSLQSGGKKAGTATVSGNTLSFNPNIDFKPGEMVSATVTSAAQGTSGAAVPAHVFQFTTATSPSSGTLGSGPDVNLGHPSQDVSLGDVDGDGDLDLLSDFGTSAPIPGNVSIRLNDGNGNFSGNQEVLVGTNPTAATLADVDNDGDMDLLTANNVNSSVSSTVSVRLNNGTGSFTALPDVSVGTFPNDLAVGDLDGDGDLDFLTANGGSSSTRTVSVRLNDGAGNFSGTQQVMVSATASSVVARDVDGDGDLDILTANGNHTVSVRLNNGNASFSGSQEVAVSGSYQVATGDIDADGDLDFVTATFATGGSISIRRNDGAGNFSGNQEITASSVINVALSDMDGDSDLDLVTADYGQNTVSVRLNDGTGTFGSAQTVAVGTNPYDLAVGDVNGDGSLDILTKPVSGQTINVRLNQPISNALAVSFFAPARNARSAPRSTDVVATFNQPLSNTTGTLGSLKVFSAQAGGRKAGTSIVNGGILAFNPTADFKPGETVFSTLTTAAQSGSGTSLPKPQVFQFTTATSRSAGTFGSGPDVAVGGAPSSVAAGDVDGDGDLDLLTAHGTGVSVRLNDGAGSFTGNQELTLTGGAPPVIVLGDVDGDGDLDFATTNTTSNSTASVSIRLNNGAGTFGAAGPDVPTGIRFGSGSNNLALRDIDGDGDLDLLAAYLLSTTGSDGAVGVFRNNGSATFTPSQAISIGSSPAGIGVGDIDNDGDLDLLASSASAVNVRLNDGTGTFATTGEQVFGNRAALLGDLNTDGYLDFITFDNSNNPGLRLNNGNGTFSVFSALSRLTGITDLALGDVDGDGDLDLVDVRPEANGADVYLNNGNLSFTAKPFLPVGLAPTGVALGDVDADGTLDLLAAAYGSRAASVRLNKVILATAPTQLTDAVSLYPNPAHGSVRLLLPAELAKQHLQVRVINTLGQVVLTQNLGSQAAPGLPLPGLAAGLYSLQLFTAQGLITKRLLVN